MSREDRQRVVLRFLAEHNLALPPTVVFRNLRLHHRITFGYRSVHNYLEYFVEQGHARRIDPKELENRELIDLEGEDDNERGYYMITEAGREWLENQ